MYADEARLKRAQQLQNKVEKGQATYAELQELAQLAGIDEYMLQSYVSGGMQSNHLFATTAQNRIAEMEGAQQSAMARDIADTLFGGSLNMDWRTDSGDST